MWESTGGRLWEELLLDFEEPGAEREVLALTAEGHTSTEIGKLLRLSPKSVDTYRARVMDKLGLKHRSELVRFALRAGLLKIE